MTKRVFFTFHYEDVVTFRANVVRKHGLTKETGTAGFFDASIWEDAELHGSEAVKRLIHRELENTTVTCALIGTDTWKRRWVRYEILKSYDRANTLFGIHINGIADKNQQRFPLGVNPFDCLGLFIDGEGRLSYFERDGLSGTWRVSMDLPRGSRTFAQSSWGRGYTLSSWVPCYDWVQGDGYTNFPSWVESAK